MIVADAPATAVPATPRHPSPCPPAISRTNSYIPKWAACAGPAPRITEATPRHRERIPSPRRAERRWSENVVIGARAAAAAADPSAPETTCEAKDGRICMRVWYQHRIRGAKVPTLIESTGKIAACSEIPAWALALSLNVVKSRMKSLLPVESQLLLHHPPQQLTIAPAAMFTPHPYPTGKAS